MLISPLLNKSCIFSMISQNFIVGWLTIRWNRQKLSFLISSGFTKFFGVHRIIFLYFTRASNPLYVSQTLKIYSSMFLHYCFCQGAHFCPSLWFFDFSWGTSLPHPLKLVTTLDEALAFFIDVVVLPSSSYTSILSKSCSKVLYCVPLKNIWQIQHSLYKSSQLLSYQESPSFVGKEFETTSHKQQKIHVGLSVIAINSPSSLESP